LRRSSQNKRHDIAVSLTFTPSHRQGFSAPSLRIPYGVSTAAPLRIQPVTAPGFGIVSDGLAMSRQGGLRTRPYPDPTIRYSPFAIRRFFPFAIRRFHHSPLAVFSIRHSLFAIRGFFPFTIRRFSLLAARHSLLAVLSIRDSLFAIRGFFPFTIRRFSLLAARR
jgi:hypothetical protein